MCAGCYVEYGCPTLATIEVIALAALLAECDDYGCLHIVTADWNLEDDNIAWCAKFMEENPGEVRPNDREGVLALAHASLEERASAMAIRDGYWRLDAKEFYAAD